MNQDKKKLLEKQLIDLENHYPIFRDYYATIAQISLKYIKSMSKLLSENMNFNYDDLEFNQSFDMVREFLQKLNPEYLYKFDKAIQENKFNIHLKKDDKDFEAYQIGAERPIRIPYNNKFSDGIRMIHEFFHYLSIVEQKPLSANNWLFGEMLSIYFEIRYAMFLVEKGYNKSNFYNLIQERLDSTYDAANEAFLNSSMADIYLTTGSVTKRRIKCYDRCNEMYRAYFDKIRGNSNNNESLESFCFNFVDTTGYLLGTLLSFNALRDVKKNDLNMIYICDNINNLEPEEILNKLKVEIKDYQLATFVCARMLFKAKRELDEESYSDSRSNRSR